METGSTVAVTGASGHVGGTLIRALLERGHRVRALVREPGLPPALEGLDIHAVRGDVRDPSVVGALVAGAEVVFHAAAVISLDPGDASDVHDINENGPRRVAEACRRHRVRRLVHFSSIHAYDDSGHGVPIDETRAFSQGPGFPHYSRSKAAGEMAVRRAVEEGLDAVIVNPSSILGPFDFRGSHMGRVLWAMYRGGMRAAPRAGYDFVDVRDVVAGALAAADRGRTGEGYLLTGTWSSLLDLARLADQAAGRERWRTEIPLGVAYVGVPFAAMRSFFSGRPAGCTMDSIRVLKGNSLVCGDKARRELGVEPRPLENVVADAVAWRRMAMGWEEAPATAPGTSVLEAAW